MRTDRANYDHKGLMKTKRLVMTLGLVKTGVVIDTGLVKKEG